MATAPTDPVPSQEEPESLPAAAERRTASPAASPPKDDSPDSDNEEEEAQERKGGEDKSDAREEVSETVTAKSDAWQAVFSAETNAWYFWNSETQETTWTNPREASDAPKAGTSTELSATSSSAPEQGLPEIDPELAWLDPTAAARSKGSGVQVARFNARTGRFQADPAMNPDRISDFSRGQRQQEAYYDVAGWEAQLGGRGLKRGAETDDDEAGKRRPSSKQVERFRQAKEDKKRKKLATWLGS
ncbi:hypothetical protein JCM8547_003903 [Rhodosporidiobolus lusitaniae]